MDKQIFISFSSKDQTKADQIVDFLEKNSCKCFISSRDLIAGQEYASQLIDNIEGSNAVVLLLSKASNESPHVLREVECAVSKKVPIIVYTLEEVSLSKSVNYSHIEYAELPASSCTALGRKTFRASYTHSTGVRFGRSPAYHMFWELHC